MAGEYGCASDTCQRTPNWLITHLNPPATLSVCDEDAPVFLIPILAGELGVDAQRLYDTIKRFTDREATREAKQAAEASVITPDEASAGTDAPNYTHTQADADADEAEAARLEVEAQQEAATP